MRASVLPFHSTGRCTVWQVPHTSGLAIVVSWTGVLPSAFSIGFTAGFSNGPISLSGAPTMKLPVNVLAKPDSSGLSSAWRSSMQAFCGAPATLLAASVLSTMRWHVVHVMPSRASMP